MSIANEKVARILAPHGTLRAAMNFGNPVLAQRDPATGEPRGVTAELARELARRLGVDVQFLEFDTAGKVTAAADQDAWDIGFLAIDPVRAAKIDFTAPYVLIEGSYLVPGHSPFQAIADVDRQGVRIAAGKNTAYDLYLTRALTAATLVHAPTSIAAIDLFMAGGADVAAGVRQPLEKVARAHTGLRVLEGRFMAIEQAMGTPKGRDTAGIDYLRSFVEEMKASGFVADALSRSGQFEARVAPPAQW